MKKLSPEARRAAAIASRKKWKANNRDAHREAQRHHRYTVRREILDLLGGGMCAHCGYCHDWRALQVDHRNGGGNKDKRTIGGNTNLWAFRNWVKANLEEARRIYQVLCANCNWIKRYENGEHPGGIVPR